MFSMCFAGTIGAFAESGEEQDKVVQQTEPVAAEVVEETLVSDELEAAAKDPANADYNLVNYTTIKPTSVNSSTENVYYGYYTGTRTYTVYVDMPSAGTLILTYMTQNGTSAYDSITGGDYSYSTTTSNGAKQRFYAIPAKGPVTLTLNCYPGSGVNEGIALEAQYAPNSATVSAPKDKWSKYYYHGGTGTTSKTTNFKVKVPSNGYLMMDLYDNVAGYSVNYKTSGFKDYELLTLKDVRRVIGVKKGTYTITVKSYAPVYKFRVKFTPVKESKYGAKKKKAANLKKKKTAKALMITNAKKTHWYKFKNKKLQKVSVVLGTKISEGNSVGGLKVTIYDKKRQIYTRTLYSDSKSLTVKLYTIGKKNKLKKGTYYVKVESYKGGNGYFTVKWK